MYQKPLSLGHLAISHFQYKTSYMWLCNSVGAAYLLPDFLPIFLTLHFMVQFTNFSGRLGTGLASFPGSCAHVEKKDPGTHCLCKLSSFYTNFCKASWLLLYIKKMPATNHTLCRRWRGSDEGTQLLVPAKWCGTRLTQSFPLKFTDRFEWSNADCYCWSDIVFELKTACISLRGSITMQCGLSAGEQKLTLILV